MALIIILSSLAIKELLQSSEREEHKEGRREKEKNLSYPPDSNFMNIDPHESEPVLGVHADGETECSPEPMLHFYLDLLEG